MTTPKDSAAVTQETGRAMQGLEEAAGYFRAVGMHGMRQRVEAAIDRLIVLDTGKPAVKESLTAHPREIALQQDATRRNFRHPINNQSHGA